MVSSYLPAPDQSCVFVESHEEEVNHCDTAENCMTKDVGLLFIAKFDYKGDLGRLPAGTSGRGEQPPLLHATHRSDSHSIHNSAFAAMVMQDGFHFFPLDATTSSKSLRQMEWSAAWIAQACFRHSHLSDDIFKAILFMHC